MTVQAVILKAVSGEIHWFGGGHPGWSPRTLQRWRERYEAYGYAGLVDKRLHARRSAGRRRARLSRCSGCTGAVCGFNVRIFTRPSSGRTR